MNVYTSDIVERKQLARQAKYRKCGSKSKKCSLSTDNMTNKQWKERCGAVQTYSMNETKTWEQFKGLPADIQRKYIKSLCERYNVSLTSLTEMFGKTAVTIRNYIDKQGLGITFKPGNKMSKEQRNLWQQFLMNGTCGNDEANESQDDGNEPMFGHEQPSETAEVSTSTDCCDEIQPDRNVGMSMRQFSIVFEGRIDAQMIANSILGIAGRDAAGKIEIVYTM